MASLSKVPTMNLLTYRHDKWHHYDYYCSFRMTVQEAFQDYIKSNIQHSYTLVIWSNPH